MWTGRLDSNETEDLRLWQKIKLLKNNECKNAIVFTGYNTDDGVIRNLGRKGAKSGSDAIRKACGSLPYINYFGDLYDTGNIDIYKLEEAQKELARRTSDIIKSKSFPINLGGGHDIAFGTYSGVRSVYPNKKIGIINFDAHLDMRPYDESFTSGTMFKQILDKDDNVDYMVIGYQEMGNTLRLRNLAHEKKVIISRATESISEITGKLNSFLNNCDIVYTTFCMDVFDITEAPGVSAPTSIGLEKRNAIQIFEKIIESKKLVALDFAEINPIYDQDNRTARLASNFIYKFLEKNYQIRRGV